MDRGTKIYALILGMVTLALAVTFLYESPKVAMLNERLEAIAKLEAFPYHFKVVRFSNGVASMSTPRSTEVPVSRILGILFPDVSGATTQSDVFQAAQKQLAEAQILAKKTVMADPDVKQVSWELDKTWLVQHGIVQ